MKNSFKSLLTLTLLLVMFSTGVTHAQTNTTNKSSKTVIYKITKHGDHAPLSPQTVIDIDKLLVSKKGIISSTTNSQAYTISVKMDGNFPEEEIKKLLGYSFKLEIESYNVIDNTK